MLTDLQVVALDAEAVRASTGLVACAVPADLAEKSLRQNRTLLTALYVEIDDHVIPSGQRRPGKSGTNARGNIRHGHGVIELFLRTVGEGYYGHGRVL